jgi:hypothetical protein
MRSPSAAGDAAVIVIRIGLVVSLLGASAAHASNPRYLTLHNRAHDSVTQVEVGEAGSEVFEVRPIDVLVGGGGSTTVRLGDSGCRFDVRLRFRDGRQVVYRAVDVCRGDALVILPPGRNA